MLVWKGVLTRGLCQIIPRAIDYFTGKALEFEVVDEDDGYSEEGDDDNDAGNSDNVSISPCEKL